MNSIHDLVKNYPADYTFHTFLTIYCDLDELIPIQFWFRGVGASSSQNGPKQKAAVAINDSAAQRISYRVWLLPSFFELYA